MLAFAIFFVITSGAGQKIDKLLIFGFLGVRFLSGMSSGWLGAFTSILIVSGALYIAEQNGFPDWLLWPSSPLPSSSRSAKTTFAESTGKIRADQLVESERLQFWVESSSSRWSDAIDDPTGETFKQALSPSVNRLSLLTQTANVIDKTPSVVPYQYGELYSYMFITLIPRFVWPDKPSVNDANQFYQVAYGLTREENLKGVSIAVGVLTEGYISFGWPGALGIMFLLGIFFDFFQSTFLSRGSGQILTGARDCPFAAVFGDRSLSLLNISAESFSR